MYKFYEKISNILVKSVCCRGDCEGDFVGVRDL